MTDFLTIDNLKAGVIKPNLFDPMINRAYAEFAEHYGTFINPCRVRKPDDKGKVERSVPQVREFFRRLKSVHPAFSLSELNEAACTWCREEYGKTRHGTTGIAPQHNLLDTVEREKLKSLPAERFEVPMWKPVKVGRDRFFSSPVNIFAMPYEYRGQTLYARKTGAILRVFDADYTLIREYVADGRLRSWLPGDFPDDKEALMQGTIRDRS